MHGCNWVEVDRHVLGLAQPAAAVDLVHLAPDVRVELGMRQLSASRAGIPFAVQDAVARVGRDLHATVTRRDRQGAVVSTVLDGSFHTPPQAEWWEDVERSGRLIVMAFDYRVLEAGLSDGRPFPTLDVRSWAEQVWAAELTVELGDPDR